jgi:superfamily II DNA or RNA helicase
VIEARTLFHDPRPKPRQYQSLAVDALHDVLQSDGKALGELATGCGKSLIAAILSERYQRALLIDPRINLCAQIAKSVEAYRLRDVEIEQGDLYARKDAPIVVASLQSLLTGDRGRKFRPDLVIVDEAHYGCGGPTLDLLDYYRSKGAVICGLTATPHGSPAIRYYGRVPVQYGVVPAIEHGWLVPISAKVVRVRSVDYSGIAKGIGEFDAKEVRRIMADETVIHEQAALVAANHKTRGAVYCASIAHARAFRDMIENRYGVKCALVHSKQGEFERMDEMKRYESGEATLIANVAVLTLGWDAPVEELHLLAPTRSLQRYLQIIGRALRPDKRDNIDSQPSDYTRRLAIANGHKPHARIIDYQDNVRHHRVCSAIDVVLPPEKVEKYREKLLQKAEEEEVELADVEAEMRELERLDRERALAEMEAEKHRRRQLVVGITFDSKSADPFAKPTAETPKLRGARMMWGPYKGQLIRLLPRDYLRGALKKMKRTPGNEWLVKAIVRELEHEVRQ